MKTLSILALLFAPFVVAAPPGEGQKASPVSVKAAADPSLEVPAEAKVYVPVVVKLKDAFPTTRVKWKLSPEPAWSEKLAEADGVGFRFTGPPAKYSIRVDYVDFKKELWGDAAADVVIIGDVTPPPIPPGPGPTPPPTPVTGPGWAIVIEQSDQRTPPQAAVLGNFAMWKNLTDKGHFWRIYDADDPKAKESGYTAAANTVGMPALLVLSKAGKLISVEKLPETSVGVEDAVKKATGL